MNSFTLERAPRNADGSLKRKEGCKTPGCRHPNWHLCTRANTEDRFPELLRGIREKQVARSVNSERAESVVEEYKKGELSMKEIASRFRLGYDTVRRVLKEASENGEVEIRRHGVNITHWSNRDREVRGAFS